MKNVLAAIVLLLLIPSIALGGTSVSIQQNVNENVEKVFKKALEHYANGRYDVVEYELQSLMELFPKNQRITAILYLQARAQYKQNKLGTAIQTLNRLIREFPQSSYRDDALFLRAAVDFKRQNYFSSAEALLSVLKLNEDQRLVSRSGAILSVLLTDYVNLPDISTLKAKFGEGLGKEVLQYAEGVHHFRSGQLDQAQTIFQNIRREAAPSQLTQKAEAYLQLIQRKGREGIKIGVILPLTGYLAEEANNILKGLKYALQTNSIARDLKIKLEVRDSRGDVLTTIEKTRELMKDPNLIAIIGELESDKTAIICSLTEEAKLPVLAPTASITGLAEKFGNLVQLSPDISIRGNQIAQYAVQTMQLKKFAILAPADSYGKDITDSFAETIDKNNATILAETWYYQGATELRSQFRHIREIGMREMMRDSVLIETPELSLAQLDSAIDARLKEKEQKFLEEHKGTRLKFVDSTAVPVTSIDAIFLPVYTNDIDYVAPQFALFNIRSQLLGADYWYDEDVLDRNRNYVSGVVFASDYFEDLSDSRFVRFRNRFRTEVGTTPGKMAVLGYDAADLLLSLLKDGINQRIELLRRLDNLDVFEGVVHPYDFRQKRRVNSFLYILKYEDNTIKRIK